MAYDLALIVGVIGISFMVAYVANSFPDNTFLSVMKFLMWGTSLWILMLIPAFGFHIVNESNATGLIIQNATKMANTVSTLNTTTMWLFVALSFLFIAYALWLIGRHFKMKRQDGI